MGIKILANKNISHLREQYTLPKEILLILIGGFLSTITFNDTMPLFVAYSAFLLHLSTIQLSFGLLGSLLAFIILRPPNTTMLAGLLILGVFQIYRHFYSKSKLHQSLSLGVICLIVELLRHLWLNSGYLWGIITALIAMVSYYCLLICQEKCQSNPKAITLFSKNEFIYPLWLVGILTIYSVPVMVGYLSISHILFIVGIMILSYYNGAIFAITGGLILGLSSVIIGNINAVWIGYWGICAIAASIGASSGKLAIWISYTLSSLLFAWLVTDWTGLIYLLGEALLAGGIFFLLPNNNPAFSPYRQIKNTTGYAKLAQAIGVLAHYKPYSTFAAPDPAPDCCSQIYLLLCHNCPNKNLCWQKDASFTQKYINQAYHDALYHGNGQMLLPEEFSSVCPHSKALNAAIIGLVMLDKQNSNHRLYIAQLQEICTNELSIISKALRQISYPTPANLTEHTLRQYLQNAHIPVQYAHLLFFGDNLQIEIALKECMPDCEAQIADLLQLYFHRPYVLLRRECNWQADNYCRIFFTPSERCFLAVHAAQRLAKDENLCGDLWRYFKINPHTECVFLIDGMGIGENAYRQSTYAAQLLQEMLKSSMAIDDALHLINNHLLLSEPNESFITLELLIIDTITLTAELYKAAGSTTYLIRDNNIQTIMAASPPLGILNDWQAAKLTLHLKTNDRLLLLSDGLAESTLNWAEILPSLPLSPQAACQYIISQNAENNDDQSVIIIDIWSIKQNGSS